jgi:type IV pilus assembly protein PilO
MLKIGDILAKLKSVDPRLIRDPRVAVRAGLGLLLAANLVAALFAFHPWGGSAEDVVRRLGELRTQYAAQQAALKRAQALALKIEKGRKEGDQFLAQYTLSRRISFSAIVGELDRVAVEAGIKPKGYTYTMEPVEGSDTLTTLRISADFEAPYANLTRFMNLLDRSPKFLIIESMQAAPQQTGPMLNISLKMDTFLSEEAAAQ